MVQQVKASTFVVDPRSVVTGEVGTSGGELLGIARRSHAGPCASGRLRALGIMNVWIPTGIISCQFASERWVTWSKGDQSRSRRFGHTPMTW